MFEGIAFAALNIAPEGCWIDEGPVTCVLPP